MWYEIFYKNTFNLVKSHTVTMFFKTRFELGCALQKNIWLTENQGHYHISGYIATNVRFLSKKGSKISIPRHELAGIYEDFFVKFFENKNVLKREKLVWTELINCWYHCDYGCDYMFWYTPDYE